jgi:hypothetical protein
LLVHGLSFRGARSSAEQSEGDRGICCFANIATFCCERFWVAQCFSSAMDAPVILSGFSRRGSKPFAVAENFTLSVLSS